MAQNAMFFYNLLLSRDVHFESAESYSTNREANYKKEGAYCIKTGACSNYMGASYIFRVGSLRGKIFPFGKKAFFPFPG